MGEDRGGREARHPHNRPAGDVAPGAESPGRILHGPHRLLGRADALGREGKPQASDGVSVRSQFGLSPFSRDRQGARVEYGQIITTEDPGGED